MTVKSAIGYELSTQLSHENIPALLSIESW